jgi:5,6,7,8-tetrahydromethanopterin hydro-lyase
MSIFDNMLTGQAHYGSGHEVAHIDLIMGPRDSNAELIFAKTLTRNHDGFTSLLALLEPNLPCRPYTVMRNKIAIKHSKQPAIIFGPAQRGVARGVTQCLLDGIIPVDKADDLFIFVSVFVYPSAEDYPRIEEFNYQATRMALKIAIEGQ